MSWTKKQHCPALEAIESEQEPVTASSSIALASGIGLAEYLKSDLAAVGVRLDTPDQQRIYDMFARYTKMKATRRELDDVDVAARVARELGHVGVSARLHMDCQEDVKPRRRGPKSKFQATTTASFSGVGELYVDEAQDFSPAELIVLLSLCHDPDGVAVAGDTCQTINPGSAFSFAAIVNAFCDLWDSGVDPSSEDQRRSKRLGAKAQREYLKVTRKAYEVRARQSRILTLRYNYRCAPGVAALAGHVTRLLLNRFPWCADQIDEEVALERMSELPVVAEVPDIDPSTYLLGTGAQRIVAVDPTRIAILVRTQATRDSLRSSGVLGTILTVPEAKGLEFDLVILVGFLSSASPDSKIWALADSGSEMTRVAGLVVAAQELLYGGASVARLSDKDRGTLYRVVQAIPELKALYVAISRARAGFALLECGRRPNARPAPWSPLLRSWEDCQLVEAWRGLQSYALGLKRSLGGRGHVHETDEMQRRDDDKEDGRSEEDIKDEDAVTEARLPEGDTLVHSGHDAERNHDMLALPAMAPALEVRFCAEGHGGGVLATAVQAHGVRLLRHAEDNPRDRWAVFGEAVATFSQAVVMVDQTLFEQTITTQLTYGTDETPSYGRAHNTCTSSSPRLEPSALLSGLESLCTSMSPGVLWRLQMCCVLSEASRESSWRHGRSAFNLLRRLAIWERVFSFLAPDGEGDVHNTLCWVAEHLSDHMKVRASLVQHILIARAWRTLSRAQFNADARRQEEALVDKAHNALAEECEERLAELQDENLAIIEMEGTGGISAQLARTHMEQSIAGFATLIRRKAAQSGAHCERICPPVEDALGISSERSDCNDSEKDEGNLIELFRWLTRAAEHLIKLHPLLMARASKCAEAGYMFLAVRSTGLAAKAFEEAAAACRTIGDVARAHPPVCEELLIANGQMASAAQEAERRAQEFALRASSCWLLHATTAQGGDMGRETGWTRAEALLSSVGRHTDAAVCAARSGSLRPKEVLDSLLGLGRFGPWERSLVWLCAGLLGGL